MRALFFYYYPQITQITQIGLVGLVGLVGQITQIGLITRTTTRQGWGSLPFARRNHHRLSDVDNLVSDNAGDIGQSEITSTVAVGQPIVLKPHQVEYRRVKVMDVHAVLNGVVADLIGCAIDKTWLYPSPRHPDRVAVWVVIPTVTIL